MKIIDLFEVKYGVNLELNKCQIVDNQTGINFVARTANNNGVVAKVALIPDIEPQPAGLITVAAGGSVLSSFVQVEPFYSGRDLYILKPKKPMTFNEKLFYSYCINKNAYRYAYGRQANKTLKDIELPEQIPDWINKISVEPVTTEIIAQDHVIDTSSWKKFSYSEIFDIERGTRITKENRISGNVPLVTAGYQNEGVAEFVTSEDNELYKDVLTIDMFGNAFFRGYEFYCDDNILILRSKFEINKFIALFLASVINMNKYRYSYGKQFRKKDFYSSSFKLPVDHNGSPDWVYMENYIKSLPFSDKI